MVEVNKFQLPFGFFITFLPLNDHNFVNWCLNYSFQFFVTASAGLFIFFYFTLTLIIINNSCLEVEAAILLVKKLDAREVAGNSGSDTKRKISITNQMKNILSVTIAVLAAQEEIRNLMQLAFFIEFNIISLIMCLCMFTLSINIFGSVAILVIFFNVSSTLFVYCWFGSRVTHQIENFTAALYDIDWLSMDVKQRKNLQLMMIMSQNMKEFNGIIRPLSLKTFQKVTRIFLQMK